jgi:predicted ATPase with chaperone activity
MIPIKFAGQLRSERKWTMDHSCTSSAEHLALPLRIPESVADVGVRKGFLEELALKILYLEGPLPLSQLAEQIRLPSTVVEELSRRLRKEQLCEVTGTDSVGFPNLAITSQGRSRALELLSLNQYAGAAPVSLQSYVQQTQMQSVRHVEVHEPDIERAFSNLVLDKKTLTQIGTAVNSGASIFIYGPTGSGKTSIAETLPRVFEQDRVWIPFAVEVDGQIIAVYDPLIQRSVPEQESPKSDARWVLCQRPAILVGGELTIEMLDLAFNPVTKFYVAPAQMKANNGVLIIDDFGRQRLRPEELLNRWVVPLDRRVDFLTLAGGRKIEIPFELIVVFSTNIDPARLVDAAFLRRIPTKIKLNTVTPDEFREIFRGVCTQNGLQYSAEIVDEVAQIISNEFSEPLRACYPRDIVNQICWAARYEGKQPLLERDAVMRAVGTYFLSAAEEDDKQQPRAQ